MTANWKALRRANDALCKAVLTATRSGTSD
jgi:hypothetical protein